MQALSLPIDRTRFFAQYRASVGTLPQSQIDGLTSLLDCIEEDKALCVEVRWVSYLLATIRHEGAGTWQPIKERGSDAYFVKRYWSNVKVRKQLGNLCEADAIKYCGRGDVQVTGLRNYTLFAKITGVDLVAQPERILDRSVSYKIASMGMREGLFTGRDLARYINSTGYDYIEARRIINGLDRGALIADYARSFEAMLTP